MLKLNPLFGDGMVLQRDKRVPIWGTGTDGATVVVGCRGHNAMCVVEGGEWSVSLKPMGAGGPFEIEVSSGVDKLNLTDVWFGDVWLAGGQSNMEMALNGALGGKEDAAAANLPEMRFYEIPPINYDDGKEHAGVWKKGLPEHVGKLSAVAYYFAEELVRTQGVPIGIVSCSKGATSACCWVPKETLKGDPSLSFYWDDFEEQTKGIDLEAYYEEDRLFNEEATAYFKRMEDGLTGDELGTLRWPPPNGPRYFLRPCGMYDAMLTKAMPYALKGFIYYQGEADTNHSDLYVRLLGALVTRWRGDWRDPGLPFLFVQLSNYGCMGNENGDDWALQREAQRLASERIPNSGMAVSIDCGDFHDIHPPDKKPVGHRLALLAREKVYGEEIDASGPTPRSARVDGGSVALEFDHAGEGLSFDGDSLKGFEIAGEDGDFKPANAELAGKDRIVARSAEVGAPAFVRYGWRNWTDANLRGNAGLPASPFRKSL